ncbi:hypothetical protein MG290_08240 [Flavobacterium sp. CBA20B-1]|uniref:DUF6891 domain-containing protein n=1 Tax=unclassified Flavobacterium TaxID=196869 RepID=UPI00222444EF|nr:MULTISPECIES: hypothetical protein [unclassified Flavobacterium]WCM40951.1 hypothetical protein MG290_08240 [Flavobacterium sp. CBA20B-1]
MKQSMSEDQQFIFDSIYTQVRSGFYSLEEIQANIIEEIEDNGFEDEISEEWAHEQINQEYETLLNESKNWGEDTQTQRLIAAFDELAENKIIALHYAGFTIDDGEYEVVEVERTLIDNDEKSEGYCFYHGQDLERAVRGEGLYISFQKVNNESDAVSKEVAKKIVEVLEKHGLKVDWNGKAATRILLPDFKWEKVYDEDDRDLLNYNYVIDAILLNK